MCASPQQQRKQPQQAAAAHNKAKNMMADGPKHSIAVKKAANTAESKIKEESRLENKLVLTP